MRLKTLQENPKLFADVRELVESAASMVWEIYELPETKERWASPVELERINREARAILEQWKKLEGK